MAHSTYKFFVFLSVFSCFSKDILIFADVDKRHIVEQYYEECNRSAIEHGKFSCNKVTTMTKETLHLIKEQNKVVLETVVHNSIHPKDIPEFEPIWGFRFLNKTLAIYQKMCTPLQPSFIQKIEALFKMLNYRFASMRTEYFQPQDLEKQTDWIEKNLDTCLDKSTPLVFMLNSCKEMVLGRQNTSFICTSMEDETNFKLYDPILDSIWSMINAIRAGCFKYFHGSYLMWHRWFLSLMDTFAVTVQKRWNNQIEERKFWIHILGPNFDIDLSNMEKCTKVIVDDSELGPYDISVARGQFVPYVRLIGNK